MCWLVCSILTNKASIVFIFFCFTWKSHSFAKSIFVTQHVHFLYINIEFKLSHCYSGEIWIQVSLKFFSSLSPLLIHFTFFQNQPHILIPSMSISTFERWNDLTLSINSWTVRGIRGWLVYGYKLHPYLHTMCNVIWSAWYQWVNTFLYLEVYLSI